MHEANRDRTLLNGTWNLWTTGKRKILFACPRCGFIRLLDDDVSPGGQVPAPVQCPGLKCGFHDTIRLLDWPPEETARIP